MKFRIKNRKNLRSTKKGDSLGAKKKKRVKSVVQQTLARQRKRGEKDKLVSQEWNGLSL